MDLVDPEMDDWGRWRTKPKTENGEMKSNRLPERTPEKRQTSQRNARRGRRGSVLGASGAAGFGTLASPRDRARAQARNAAERRRVEEMLASAPTHLRALTPTEPASLAEVAPVPVAAPVQPYRHAEPGCPVCASQSVTSDEVMQAGATTRMSECLNCDHRWTRRLSRRFSERGASMARGVNRRPNDGATPVRIAVG